MHKKTVFIAIFSAFLITALNPQSFALNTRAIDNTRDKQILDDKDVTVIDDFLKDAAKEILNTKDFTTIAKTRTQIVSRTTSTEEGAKAQYWAYFAESARKHVGSALDQAAKIEDPPRRLRVMLNLLILIEGIGDPQLAEKTIPLLENSNQVIKYWAVHCLTSPALIEQLNNATAANVQLTATIVKCLKSIAENSDPETMILIAEFSVGVDSPQAKELLLTIADSRINKYADGSVTNELIDCDILQLLYNTIKQRNKDTGAAGRFCQLYSYALQRYTLNIAGKLNLSESAKTQLASVLVEVENCCIWRLLELPQSIIKRAVEQGDYIALSQEHSKLFGDQTKIGVLSEKLGVKFKNPDGSPRTYPLELPDQN